MSALLYNPWDSKKSTNIDLNLALQNRLQKISQSTNPEYLTRNIVETTAWCEKNYPDGQFKNIVINILNAFNSNDCDSALHKLCSVKQNINQQSRLVDQLFTIGQKVEEIGVMVVSNEGEILYDPETEDAMKYFVQISSGDSSLNVKPSNIPVGGSNTPAPSGSLSLNKALRFDKSKSLLENSLEHQAYFKQSLSNGSNGNKVAEKKSLDDVNRFNEFLKEFMNFETWEEFTKDPVQTMIPDEIKNLGDNNAYYLLCFRLYSIRAYSNLPGNNHDDIENYLNSRHDDMYELNQLYKVYKSQEHNFDDFNIYLPFKNIRQIVIHLNKLFVNYLNRFDINLDTTTNTQLIKLIKKFKLACIKLSTLVSWANSLKNNTRLDPIISQSKPSTEINENVFIYKIHKYLVELCDAYNMSKGNEPQKKARRKAINNALNRLINLLYVMIGDPKGRTIYHKGKRLRSLKIDETIVSIIRVIIKLLNALKRKS